MKLDALDKLFSEYIRRRAMQRVGGCERCETPKVDFKQLQCCHFHGRSKKTVRWDEDNAVGLCYGCHSQIDSQITEKEALIKKILGDDTLLLARMRQTRPKPDKAVLMLYYKKKLQEV